MLNGGIKRFAFRLIGIIFCIVPVALTVIWYFPLWQLRGGGAVLSGAALVLILVSLVPLFRVIKRMLKSPSAYAMWLVSFVVFFCLSKIADEMTVISFVGFVGNLIGALFFHLGRREHHE